MSKELRALGLTPGTTNYYVNVVSAAGQYMIASTGSTEAFNSANWTTYAITPSEATGTGDFYADLPSGAAAGHYDYVYRQKSGASAAVGDLAATSPGTYDKTPTGTAGYPGGPVDSVTNAVGSVTGSVGSVTGSVASVTGNVGGNVVGSVGSVTAGVTVTTNNDKTGYALTPGEHTTIQTDVQTGLTSQGYTTTRATKVDNLDAAISTRSTYAGGAVASVTAGVNVTQIAGQTASASAGVTFPATVSSFAGGAVASVSSPVTVGTNNDKTGYGLTSGEHTTIQTDVTTGLTTQGYTTARATKVDNLDAAISTRSVFAGGAVASVTAGVNVTQIAGQTVIAAASVTFPATVSSFAGGAVASVSSPVTANVTQIGGRNVTAASPITFPASVADASLVPSASANATAAAAAILLDPSNKIATGIGGGISTSDPLQNSPSSYAAGTVGYAIASQVNLSTKTTVQGNTATNTAFVGDSSLPTVDNFFLGQIVKIASGPSLGASATVASYIGQTKQFNLFPAFPVGVNLSAGTQLEIV